MLYNRANLSIYDPVDENESAGVYNLIDFNADLARERLFYQPNFFGVIEPVKREARKLFDAGVTKFLYLGKPILYGTIDADFLSATDDISVADTPTLYEFEDNGVVLIGGDGDDVLGGEGTDDIIIGGEGQDILTGFNGEDILEGGKGDDQLRGGGDRDIAIFSDNFENYDYSISSGFLGLERIITFSHVRGTQTDGTDTLENIEWAKFNDTLESTEELVSRTIPLPLEDGVEATEFIGAIDTTPSPNPNDLPTPPSVTISAPVAMLDGNVDYTLNISPYQPDTEYNFSYIFDTSASMDAVELQQAKDAYTDLTNYFIDNEIAENINFAVIQFSRNATPYFNLTAEEAISTIQGLTTTAASQGTKYNDALYQGMNFLTQSPLDALNTTNIAYFVSDGRSQTNFYDPYDQSYVYDAMNLRRFSNVQAFGIDDGTNSPGGVTQSQLNFVDSNQGLIVGDASNLSAELQKSGLAGNIAEVNILVDGEVVETVTPDQLTDSPLGLTYEGSVEELDVSIDAENIITAEVVFTPESNLAATTVDHIVTAGDGEATDGEGNDIAQSNDGNEDPFERTLDGSDGDDEITLGYADRGANGGAGGDEIIGNERDNILNGGAGNDTISAYGGDDTITTGAGRDKVNGGAGIDTVVYGDVTYQGNNISLRKAANSVSYNNTDTLTNVEFIQYKDLRIATDNLEVTPVVEVAEISITEGNSGNTTAQVDLNLSTPAPVDVTFDYSSEDLNAIAAEDYVATSGQVTIPAGETSARIDLEVIGDVDYEELEQFALNFSNLSGATFNNNRVNYSIPITIENDDVLSLNLVGDDNDNYLAGEDGDDTINGARGNDTLAGNDGKDRLVAKAGNDILDGGNGSDTLYGDAGNDTLTGGLDDDTINGGADNDTIVESGNTDFTLTNTTLTGRGSDTVKQIEFAQLTGGAGNNVLMARDTTTIGVTLDGAAGNDNLVGGAKNDSLMGRDGNDRLAGKNGNDSLEGSIGFDLLYGDDGNDTLIGGDGYDRLFGNADNDILQGEGGNDTINGGAGSDRLVETGNVNFTLTDTTLVGNGNDTISQIEFARLTGGAGNNVLMARDTTEINVTLDGAAGNDNLVGGAKNDSLMGREGNDRLAGKNSSDLLDGANGSDTLYGDDGNDTLIGGDGYDRLFGNADNDILQGEDGNDTINGGAGSDRLIGGMGNDILYGQDGNDRLAGKAGNDRLTGGLGNDTLYGDWGSDRLNGGLGNDTLYGGVGNDTLFGNGGNDVFVLEPGGEDVIIDFNRDFDLFGLTVSIGFSDLSIIDNTDRTAALIRDTTDDNRLLATVNNLSASNITVDDFVTI